jgi:O-antigen ligase
MKTNIFIKTLFLVVFVLLLITPFVGTPTLLDGMDNSRFFYFAGLSITTFLFAGVGIFTGADRKKIAINFIDLFVALFLIYSTVRLLFTEYATFYNFHFLSQLCLTLLYFCVKWLAEPSANLAEKCYVQLLIAGFLVTGLLQAGIGLMQFYGFVPSHSMFKVIGTFGNPNHYAAYLVSVLPLAFGMYLLLDDTHPGLRLLKYLGAITAMAIVLVLPGTQTRAAWLAGGVGMGFLVAIKYDVWGKVRTTLNRSWKEIVAFVSILAAFALVAGALFQYKPDSAAGRLLIWKITAGMIAEKPLFGIGYDRFAVDYDHHQAAYFGGGLRAESEQRLAQHTKHAHNDYLQIFAEGGAIGFLLFCGIIFSALFAGIKMWMHPTKESERSALMISAQASLVALLVNALFFFPLKMLETNLHFYLLLGLISAAGNNQEVLRFQPGSTLKKVIGILLICCAVFLGYRMLQLKTAYDQWQIATHMVTFGNPERPLALSETILPLLNDNGEFLFFYGGLLYKSGRFADARQVFNECRKRFTDQNLEILLAQTCQQLGESEEAERHLRTAINMVPHKFHARYLLAKHYADRGDTTSALRVAEKIINLPVKVPSIAVTEIKNEARNLLVSLGKNQGEEKTK